MVLIVLFLYPFLLQSLSHNHFFYLHLLHPNSLPHDPQYFMPLVLQWQCANYFNFEAIVITIFNLNFQLQICRNATDFLYWPYFFTFNSVINSVALFVGSVELHIFKNKFSVNMVFFLSIPFKYLFFLTELYSLSLMATIMMKSGEIRCHCLVPVLKGK